MGIVTVLWEMYLIIFGMGIQTTSHGEPYLHFLVPGIVSMATMTGSFSAIAQNMSVQRLYEKALDQIMVSPTPLWQFILGQVLGGALRGLYAGCVILLLTYPIRTDLIFNSLSLFIMLLNGMVFSTIGLVLSFMAKSYSDAPRYTSFIITPMSFLCNTFFSTEQMPAGFRQAVAILPLSQTSSMIRAIANGQPPDVIGFVILGAYLVVFGLISMVFIYRKKNL